MNITVFVIQLISFLLPILFIVGIIVIFRNMSNYKKKHNDVIKQLKDLSEKIEKMEK